MRLRARHLVRADRQLQDWASWTILNINSGPLGASTARYENMPRNPPSAIHPETVMPPHISRVYWEIQDAPEDHRDVIHARYLNGDKKLSERRVTRMLEYMAARLR